MNERASLILLVLLIAFNTVLAQESEDSSNFKPKYGIFLNYNFNIHTSDFSELPGILSCCYKNMGGTGDGFSFGALFDYPITDEWGVNLRLAYSDISGLLVEREAIEVMLLNEAKNDYVSGPGVFEYQLEADISTIGLEVLASYKFLDNFFGYLGFGIAVLSSKEYNYQEIIVEPNKGYFKDTNRERIRNVNSGDLQETPTVLSALTTGLSYQLQMNSDSSFFLSPEAYYSLWFTPIVTNSGWLIHSFRAGLAIKYLKPPPPPPPPLPPAEAPNLPLPLPIKPPLLFASINAVQIDSTNKEQDKIDIKIEDFVSHNMSPLLNYVFFNENSSDLPERYIQLTPEKTDKFNISMLQKLDVMETYYHILNITGLRLKNDKKSIITLIGSNSYTGKEKKNLKLSRKRAEAIREYLVNVWGIPKKQMKVKYRHLPKDPSNVSEPAGQQENRRVEIVSKDWKIVEPVIVVDTTRNITKTTIRFNTDINAQAGIKSWELLIKQAGSKLKSFKGTNKISQDMDWIISSDSPSAPTKGGKISYVLTVEDSVGQVAKTEEKWLPVEQLTIEKKRIEKVFDREYEYYSLILFDYGKYKLRKEHRKVINLIKGRLTKDSKVIITGHTDIMGRVSLNKRIAKSRAKAVAKYLGIKDARIIGIGEDDLLYDNSLPEGRFYCRTVRVTIETPVENK